MYQQRGAAVNKKKTVIQLNKYNNSLYWGRRGVVNRDRDMLLYKDMH